MPDRATRHADDLDEARARCAEDLVAVEKVRELLAKADGRRAEEPGNARKWNRVIENLEHSLDFTRARLEHSRTRLHELERNSTRIAPAGSAPVGASPPSGPGEGWASTLKEVGALSLEQASQLQSRIDAGEIHDPQLEAGLELANQMHSGDAPPSGRRDPRRQRVLRAAVEKIRTHQFEAMGLDEIRLVLACHSLLECRLEPAPRDRRLRRLIDGSMDLLRRRKAALEGPPQ